MTLKIEFKDGWRLVSGAAGVAACRATPAVAGSPTPGECAGSGASPSPESGGRVRWPLRLVSKMVCHSDDSAESVERAGMIGAFGMGQMLVRTPE